MCSYSFWGELGVVVLFAFTSSQLNNSSTSSAVNRQWAGFNIVLSSVQSSTEFCVVHIQLQM